MLRVASKTAWRTGSRCAGLARAGGIAQRGAFNQPPPQRASFFHADGQLAAYRFVEFLPARVDRLVKADLPPLADDHLAATHADVNQHVDFMLIFAAADKPLDAAIDRGRLPIQRIDGRAAAMQLFQKVIDILVPRREHDDFVLGVGPLPNFAGIEKAQACDLIGFKRKDGGGLEFHRCCQLVGRHHGQAEILHVHDVARQRGDDLPARKRILPEHLPDQIHRHRHAHIRRDARLLRNGHARRRVHRQRFAGVLELQHLHAVKPDIQADRLKLAGHQTNH